MTHIVLLLNALLTVLLLTALGYMLFLIFYGLKRREEDRYFHSDPEFLTLILRRMIDTVEQTGDWEKLEAMRYHVRVSLRTLDKLRHDVSNQSLRASKRSYESKMSSKSL